MAWMRAGVARAPVVKEVEDEGAGRSLLRRGRLTGGQPVLQLEVGAEGVNLGALLRGVVELVRCAEI